MDLIRPIPDITQLGNFSLGWKSTGLSIYRSPAEEAIPIIQFLNALSPRLVMLDCGYASGNLDLYGLDPVEARHVYLLRERAHQRSQSMMNPLGFFLARFLWYCDCFFYFLRRSRISH